MLQITHKNTYGGDPIRSSLMVLVVVISLCLSSRVALASDLSVVIDTLRFPVQASGETSILYQTEERLTIRNTGTRPIEIRRLRFSPTMDDEAFFTSYPINWPNGTQRPTYVYIQPGETIHYSWTVSLSPTAEDVQRVISDGPFSGALTFEWSYTNESNLYTDTIPYYYVFVETPKVFMSAWTTSLQRLCLNQGPLLRERTHFDIVNPTRDTVTLSRVDITSSSTAKMEQILTFVHVGWPGESQPLTLPVTIPPGATVRIRNEQLGLRIGATEVVCTVDIEDGHSTIQLRDTATFRTFLMTDFESSILGNGLLSPGVGIEVVERGDWLVGMTFFGCNAHGWEVRSIDFNSSWLPGELRVDESLLQLPLILDSTYRYQFPFIFNPQREQYTEGTVIATVVSPTGEVFRHNHLFVTNVMNTSSTLSSTNDTGIHVWYDVGSGGLRWRDAHPGDELLLVDISGRHVGHVHLDTFEGTSSPMSLTSGVYIVTIRGLSGRITAIPVVVTN